MEFEFLEFYECTNCGRTLNGKNPEKILDEYKMTCSDCPKIVYHGDDGYCSKYNGLLIEDPSAVTTCTEVN
jgi:DNA-directed RNA polymerase subunit RPC12/RpoP